VSRSDRGLHNHGALFALCLVTATLVACNSGSTAVAPIRTGPTLPTPAPTSTPAASPKPSATPVGPPTATPAPANCTTPTTPVSAAGGTVTANTGNFFEAFGSGAFSSTANVVLNDIPQASLPAPLVRARFLHRDTRRPLFTQGAGNTYVVALCTSFGGVTLNSSASLSGAAGIVPSSIPVGTQLNIAINQGSTWVDVGTATVGAGGTFSSSLPTSGLPGIAQAGTYLVYEPAAGSSTISVNLGFALIADDGTAPTVNGLQFVQIEDPATGLAEPTPTTTYFPIPNAGDLDGEGLTPDAQHGSVVDGSNLVYFYSGIPQHAFVLSPNTVDITAYGGDGDSIASLPGGDQVVASGNGTQLAVISGILSGSPVVSDTINNPGGTSDRDGMVISNDGKTMLSRGESGLDVWGVAPVAAHAGSTGTGTTSFSFTLEATLTTTIPTPYGEDGRDEMAISPADSSRAVVAGFDASGNPEIVLLSGLPNAPAVSILHPRLPPVAYRKRQRLNREPSTHRAPLFSLAPTGASILYGVAITPDGTTAYVSSDVGVITITGVNTGTLAQSGSLYAPTVYATAGTSVPFVFEGAPSLGVLPDGKYLVEVVDSDGDVGPTGSTNSTQGDGILITVPIASDHSLGPPAGQLNQVVTTFNDQIIFH